MPGLSSRIRAGFIAFVVLAVAAVVLPRFAARGGDGLAAGATAALAFFGVALAAFGVAIIVLWWTLRGGAGLSAGTRVAGFLPLPLFLAGVIVVVVLVQRARDESPAHDGSPRTLTPTATPPTPP